MSSITSTDSSPRDSLHTAGSVFFVSSTGRVLKLPIPSKSQRDPLRWSFGKRAMAFVALSLYSSICSFEVSAPGLLYVPVQNEFGQGPSGPVNVQALSTVMNLFVGVGYVLAVPFSTALGRRPVMVSAAVMTCLSTLWAGLCTSFGQLLAALALQALATGAAITMSTIILIDMTFIHERPNALSLYWSTGAIVMKLAFVILPAVIDINSDWRTIYYIGLALSLIALVVMLLFLPETYFFRPPVALDGRVLLQTGAEKVLIYDERDVYVPVDTAAVSRDMSTSWASRLIVTRAPGTKWRAMGWTYMQMLYCMINPLVFWVGVLAGVNLSAVILLNLTQLNTLVEIWGKNPDTVSLLLGVAGIVGGLLAIPATGPLMTWFIRYQSLRCGGMRHAEVYLFSFSIPVISAFLSILINGLAAQHRWGPGCFYVASALSIFSYISGNVAFTLWITEAFPQWASAALAIQLFVCNLVSFGIGNGIMAWVDGKNVRSITGLVGGLILFLGLLAVPAVFWGKDVRQYIHGRFSNSERAALRPQ